MTPLLPGLRRVYQTRHGIPPVLEDGTLHPDALGLRYSDLGDCWESALATVVGVPRLEVPDRAGTLGDALADTAAPYLPQLQWLATRGLSLRWGPPPAPPGLAIATIGAGPLTPGHTIVCWNGWPVHDPGEPLELAAPDYWGRDAAGHLDAHPAVLEYAVLVPL